MSAENNSSSCCSSPFLPLVLVAVSLLIVFVWQLSNISSQRNALQNLVQNQQQTVQQARQIQSGLEKLVNDLVDLAQSGDDDAKAIVTKYGISRQGGATNAAPAAPAK